MQAITRRQLLQSAARSTALIPFAAMSVADLIAVGWQQKADALTERRAQTGAVPIDTTKLTDNLTMLSGPGGNVIVLNGPDGKLVVDSFVLPAWPKLKQALDGMAKGPIKTLIDTHWHFDHADNNENFRKAGAGVLAHVNTKKRLSETHDLLGMHFPASPAGALPTETFAETHKLEMNGEAVETGHIPPAHTDTDVYIRFARGNVLHLGDVFFNGMYPFIDASTGGSINGQIAGATLGLKLADNATKIVPGHGPLADKAALTTYRDMMVTVRDRVQKHKTAGRKLEEVLAAKPTADLDATWAKGFMQGADFIAIVYNTLR
jgi:glyoxylase-like metal-dependent hydrolase (beta-lactamase superfamily II)